MLCQGDRSLVEGIGAVAVEVARQRDYLPRKITMPGTDPAL
jgi:hypothetical protein